jgi:hypothetical protein
MGLAPASGDVLADHRFTYHRPFETAVPWSDFDTSILAENITSQSIFKVRAVSRRFVMAALGRRLCAELLVSSLGQYYMRLGCAPTFYGARGLVRPAGRGFVAFGKGP